MEAASRRQGGRAGERKVGNLLCLLCLVQFVCQYFLLLAPKQNKQIHSTGSSGFYDPHLIGGRDGETSRESLVSVLTSSPNTDWRGGRCPTVLTCLLSLGVFGGKVTEGPEGGEINLQFHLASRPHYVGCFGSQSNAVSDLRLPAL